MVRYARFIRGEAMRIRRAALITAVLVAAALLPISVTALADAAAAAVAGGEAGGWQPHKYTFNFMGFTSTYSCNGLEDKLKVLLRMSGASEDTKVVGSCSRGIGVPDRLATAYLTFSTLQPGSAAGPMAGEWRHIALSPKRPFEFDYGDCELIEQFRDKVLPMFATRNVNSNITCVPHQDSGSNFNLSYDVFAPPVPPKKS
jgi:hypothetical protein